MNKQSYSILCKSVSTPGLCACHWNSTSWETEAEVPRAEGMAQPWLFSQEAFPPADPVQHHLGVGEPRLALLEAEHSQQGEHREQPHRSGKGGTGASQEGFVCCTELRAREK